MAVTSGLTFLIGLGAGIIAFFSYRTNRRNLQFQNATHTYRKYLELAVEWPQLAEPSEHPAMLTAPLELSRYEWFVGILLRACEELLEYIDALAKTDRGRRDEWCRTVKSQLEFHVRYFRENPWFKTEANQVYSNRLLRVVNEVIRENEEKERRKAGGSGFTSRRR